MEKLTMKEKLVVTITGAAGQVASGILSEISSGNVYNSNYIELRLLDKTENLFKLEALKMELEDCCYQTLTDIVVTDDLEVAFKNCNRAILIGAKQRSYEMKRTDLISDNAKIFQLQGMFLNKYAAKDVSVIVVGNPSNTNCYVCMKNAPDINKNRFSSLMLLDSNRAKSLLSQKMGVPKNRIKNIIIWGNHGNFKFPDVRNSSLSRELLNEHKEWLQNEFIKEVNDRGSLIIKMKGYSAGLSASKALIDHIKSFENVTQKGEWFSAGVPSDGSYGIPNGIIFSFPIISLGNGEYRIKDDLILDDFETQNINYSIDELIQELERIQEYI